MNLGLFSLSLSVSDLEASRAFYEALGFVTRGGDADNGWLILTQGDTKIGLFQGMFPKNMLTFNPGWDADAQPLAEFLDVRAIQERLDAAGIELTSRTEPDGTGPAHISLTDPDGNPILIDQHVPRP